MKRILLSIFTLIGIFALAGCQRMHQWIEVTYAVPKMCSVCHTTKGSKKAHTISSGESIPKCTECNAYVVELTAKEMKFAGCANRYE